MQTTCAGRMPNCFGKNGSKGFSLCQFWRRTACEAGNSARSRLSAGLVGPRSAADALGGLSRPSRDRFHKRREGPGGPGQRAPRPGVRPTIYAVFLQASQRRRFACVLDLQRTVETQRSLLKAGRRPERAWHRLSSVLVGCGTNNLAGLGPPPASDPHKAAWHIRPTNTISNATKICAKSRKPVFTRAKPAAHCLMHPHRLRPSNSSNNADSRMAASGCAPNRSALYADVNCSTSIPISEGGSEHANS
jgi:hypothetical protein